MTAGAWILGILWLMPVLFAFWSAFHPAEFSTSFELFAPLTLENFTRAWSYAPFPRYLMNTFILVTLILCRFGQQNITLTVKGKTRLSVGDHLRLDCKKDHIHLFDTLSGRRLGKKEKDKLS